MDKEAIYNLEYGIPFVNASFEKAGLKCTLRALTEEDSAAAQQLLKADGDKRLAIARCVILLLGDENYKRIYSDDDAATLSKRVPLRIQNEILKQGLRYNAMVDEVEEQKKTSTREQTSTTGS